MQLFGPDIGPFGSQLEKSGNLGTGVGIKIPTVKIPTIIIPTV